VDSLAGLAQRTVSVGAQELMCRLNQNAGSFAKASENLLRAAQLRASKEQVRQVVEQAGQAVVKAQADFSLLPAWTAEQCVVGADGQGPNRTTRLYLGVDGVLAPMVTTAEKQKRRETAVKKRRAKGASNRRRKPLPPVRGGADQRYKELKLVQFYDQGNQRQHCVVTRGDHRQAGMLINREARRLHAAKADQRIANTDGAVWIDHRIDEAQLSFHGRGLDFYHLRENVLGARRTLFGDDEAGKAWAGQLLHTVKHQGYQPFWDQLTEYRAGLRSAAKRKALDRLLHYVAQRRHLINYPRFIACGWQIGSGPTEAGCKTVTLRLKGRGRRWEPRHAQALANLAAIDQSGQWDTYWQTRLARISHHVWSDSRDRHVGSMVAMEAQGSRDGGGSLTFNG
jgi:hypothetical protein